MVEYDPIEHPGEDADDAFFFYCFVGLVTTVGLGYLSFAIYDVHRVLTAGGEINVLVEIPAFVLGVIVGLLVVLMLLTAIGFVTYTTYGRIAAGLEGWR